MDIYMSLSAFKEYKGNGRQFKAFLSLSKVEKFKIRQNVHILSWPVKCRKFTVRPCKSTAKEVSFERKSWEACASKEHLNGHIVGFQPQTPPAIVRST